MVNFHSSVNVYRVHEVPRAIAGSGLVLGGVKGHLCQASLHHPSRPQVAAPPRGHAPRDRNPQLKRLEKTIHGG